MSVTKETEISKDAGRLVGKIYDAFLSQYNDPESPESLKSLNALCVRLVFCLYAEDADVFGKRNMFRDYLARFEVRDLRRALIDLFRILDEKPEYRDPYTDPDLAAFPYVNGGLFSDTNIEIPTFTEEIKTLLVTEACDFDWSEISPTIFGAVFESTLNPETRRSGGMHYTSIENIHKVIDPLFLNDLKEELEKIKEIDVAKTKKDKLGAFQEKLASLKFLDPACGSGNFLTESFLALRRLENEVLRLKIEADKSRITGQIVLGLDTANPIKVSIEQFYGIEINDFAVSVAMTALWIAESQMLKETEDVVHQKIDFLPLKTFTNITEGNALRMDWRFVGNIPGNTTIYADETFLLDTPEADLVNDAQVHYGKINLVTKNIHIGAEKTEREPLKFDYIMGNPPFYGARLMTSTQKEDLEIVFGKLKGIGNLDYVSGWYRKAADFINQSETKVALVSTNSITQGEQVSILWKTLLDEGIKINFAYRTFRWDSEASDKAHVHCVIIGFSNTDENEKIIFDGDDSYKVKNINPYLIDAPDILIGSRSKPICDVPEMKFGSMANDDGNLILSAEEYSRLKENYSELLPYTRMFLGAEEYINKVNRYCFWLKNTAPEIMRHPVIRERLEKVKEKRQSSSREATRKLADYPYLFGEDRQPDTDYLIIPRVSSERRRYIPIGYLSKDVIASDACLIIPEADMYMFGIITSNVHNSWMRAVAGRLEMRYRYSAKIVYNNFPWPNLSDGQKAKIEETAQAILDARSLYPDSSLADLYDPLTMPPELQKAHTRNDAAVMRAYGFDIKTMSEPDCVAALMRLYKQHTGK